MSKERENREQPRGKKSAQNPKLATERILGGGDEDPVQRVRGGGGAGALLRRRGRALRRLRRGGPRRQQARQQAPARAAPPRRAARHRKRAAQVRHMPGIFRRNLQEASGYFFCLEDRALLCRDCDVAIHTVNSFVSAHQRFLLTGVQVGLEPADPVPPIADKHVIASGGSVDSQQKQLARKIPTVQFSGESSVSIASQNAIGGDYSRQISPKYLSDGSSKHLLSSQTTTVLSNQMNRDSDPAYNLPFSGGNRSNSLPDWPVDEFFSNLEYGLNFGFSEHGSSKGDNGKLGSAGGSPQCRLAEGLFAEELLGQVPGLDPDDPWVVPEVPSPPTASDLCWQGNLHYPVYDNAMFVPEIRSLQQSSQDHCTVSSGFKRRRREF